MATTGRTETRQERAERLKRQIRPGFAELAARITEENREALDILEEYDRKRDASDGRGRSAPNGER